MSDGKNEHDPRDTARLDALYHLLPFPIAQAFGGDAQEMRECIDEAMSDIEFARGMSARVTKWYFETHLKDKEAK